jgi:hypothetical protein
MRLSDLGKNTSRALEQVNWRDTRIEVKPGAVACFGRDAVKAVTERQHAHSALDAMMSRLNMTENDAPRLHAALDKLLDGGVRLHAALDRLLDSDSEEEPEVGDSDEEEEENEAEENEPHEKVKIPYDKLHGSLDAMSLDQLRRRLDSTFGADDAAGLSRTVAMDAAGDLKLGEPGDVAMDAIAKLPIRFDINPRAKAPWFHSLFTWISKYPKGARVRDLHQPTLQRLLHELKTAA